VHSSHGSASVDIELQKQSAWPADTPGDHDDVPLLGDSGGDAGAGDMVAMPVAAWLLMVAAVSCCRAV